MPDCIVPACKRNATNTLGIRLRRPDTTAIWAPQTDVYVCDTHARSGARISVVYEATTTGRVEVRTQGGTEPTVKRASIKP